MNKKRLIQEALKDVKQSVIDLKQHQQIVEFLSAYKPEEFKKLVKITKKKKRTTPEAKDIVASVLSAYTELYAKEDVLKWAKNGLDIKLIMALILNKG